MIKEKLLSPTCMINYSYDVLFFCRNVVCVLGEKQNSFWDSISLFLFCFLLNFIKFLFTYLTFQQETMKFIFYTLLSDSR